MPEQLSC